MDTLFFVEFEGGSDDVAGIVDDEYALDRGFDAIDGFLYVLGHLSCNN